MLEVIGTGKQDPASVLDHTILWEDWLDEGDTINDSEWIVPAGITAITDTFTTITGTVWLTGGTIGQGYRVTNHVTTVDGREDERSLRIVIADR